MGLCEYGFHLLFDTRRKTELDERCETPNAANGQFIDCILGDVVQHFSTPFRFIKFSFNKIINSLCDSLEDSRENCMQTESERFYLQFIRGLFGTGTTQNEVKILNGRTNRMLKTTAREVLLKNRELSLKISGFHHFFLNNFPLHLWLACPVLYFSLFGGERKGGEGIVIKKKNNNKKYLR